MKKPKRNRNDITELLLKVALDTIKQANNHKKRRKCVLHKT